MPFHVHYEQAVYGSFPFWDKGYAFLAHSPGCKPEWLAAFQCACQKFGEPPSSANRFDRALFSKRLTGKNAPWLIAGVTDSGTDDHGRPVRLHFTAFFSRTANSARPPLTRSH